MRSKKDKKKDMERLKAYTRLCSTLTAAIGVFYPGTNINEDEFNDEWWLSHLLADLAIAYDRIHGTDGAFMEAMVDVEFECRQKLGKNQLKCPEE